MAEWRKVRIWMGKLWNYNYLSNSITELVPAISNLFSATLHRLQSISCSSPNWELETEVGHGHWHKGEAEEKHWSSVIDIWIVGVCDSPCDAGPWFIRVIRVEVMILRNKGTTTEELAALAPFMPTCHVIALSYAHSLAHYSCSHFLTND